MFVRKSFTLLAAAALFVSACSSSTAPAESSAAATEAPAASEAAPSASEATGAGPYVIGFSNVSVANSFRVQLVEEVKYWAAQHPDVVSKFIVTDAGGDANKQIADMEDLISQNVDALIVAPASDTALNPTIDKAVAAGIPVIVVNSGTTSTAVSGTFVPPYREWTKDTTAWLVEQLGGKGNVIALRGIAGLAAEADEWAGAEEALAAASDIKFVCTEYASWDYAAAKTAVANCLANRPQVDGVLALGDGMTWAAAEVLKQQGYDVTKIPMIGIGGSNGFLKYWVANKLNAYVLADPTNISVTALQAAIEVLQGKTSESQVTKFVIDNSSVDKFVKADLPDSAWVGTELPDAELKTILNK